MAAGRDDVLLSLLALPTLASILMLTADGFVTTGNLVLLKTLAAAAAGGSAKDQVGYWACRTIGTPFPAKVRSDPAHDWLFGQALANKQKRGVLA